MSISSLNKVYSVAVFSNKPLEKIEEIYLSQKSKTSRLLTKVIFQLFLKKDVTYKELEDYENIDKKAVLLIGDNAIKLSDRFKYIFDLSGIWYKKTSLPFVFALWCVRKDVYEKNRIEIKKLRNILLKSKERFFIDIENIVKENEKGFKKEFAVKYLKNLDFCLSEEHIKSLKLFSEYLLQLGIIKELPEFKFTGE